MDRHSRRLWPRLPNVLYDHIAALQPQTVIMMNSGITDGTSYNVDLRLAVGPDLPGADVPPASGHQKWREIEGKNYYLPGEVCDPIGKEWFWVKGDKPRSDESLATQFEAAAGGEPAFWTSRRTYMA